VGLLPLELKAQDKTKKNVTISREHSQKGGQICKIKLKIFNPLTSLEEALL